MNDEIVGKGAQGNHISAQALTPEVSVVQMVDTILPPLTDLDPRKHSAAVTDSF